MQARYEDASMTAHGLNNFKTKNLNMWVYSLAKWANMAKWKELCNDPFIPVDRDTCYAGLDLATVSDFAAMAIDFPGDAHKQIYQFWVPEDRVNELATQCSIPLHDWVADGYVTATPGPVIDYSYIASYIEELRNRFDLHLIAADRWRLNELARYMPDWFTEMTFEFSQAMKSMSPSIGQFERFYLTGKLNAGGNPVMTWMMSCAEARSDSNGNIKLVKRDRRTSGARIDGVIAAIMALDTAVTQHASGLTEADLTTMINFF
jgi:phage terminase large subunit-like protein